MAPVLGINETVSPLPIELPPDFEFQPVDIGAESESDLSAQYAGVHDTTGVSHVRDEFGLRGGGQTVAVIDSGVAWDHADLGGGFGAGHRVVGGWDFAENDADPFDDGPSGFHGTHVAGIVGSSNETYSGVAPEADIVALRVFDDNGAGYFHWVEQALQWVHEHRGEFANPITAVNLSLGASWNADNVPGWAMLEDEFAQLEADGIFIAVAAGNSFQQYQTPGLSYPAASPHVTPVASTDADGGFSYFSQRNERVLAAPGRGIISTVPDARGNNDGLANDYGSASGTSMASPYVAGASVLVREAMEFAGMTGITQDTIYEHLRDTAQIFFDPATSASYHRIDVHAAIEALMPEDEFGAGDAAHAITGFDETVSIDGTINRVHDVDSFTFTAALSGEMRWDVGDATHDFVAHWSVDGAEFDADGGSLVFDVVGGQAYTVSLASTDGIGHYSFDAEFVATDPNLGVVDVAHRNGMSFGEEFNELQFTASRTGLMTVEAFFAAADGNINLQVKDSHGAVAGFGGQGGDNERVDAQVYAGQQYTIEVIGSNEQVDIRLTNLVHANNGTVTVYGTDGDDNVSVSAGGTHHIQINGVDYHFDASDVRSVRVLAGAGGDHVRMAGSYAVDFAEMRDGYSRLASDDYEYQARDAESVEFSSLGRDDQLRIHGSDGDDHLFSDSVRTTLTTSSSTLTANGFERVYVDATGGGDDAATLHDTHGADRFIGRSDHSILEGVDYYKHVSGFDELTVHASTGRDVAELHGTDGDEQFTGRHDVSTLAGAGFEQTVHGFDEVRTHAGGGHDEATLFDSAGNDRYSGREGQSSMRGDAFLTIARGFDRVVGIAENGGRDIAEMYGSHGDDTASMRHNETTVRSESHDNSAIGFDEVALRSTAGGHDVVHFYDSEGDDRFYGHSTHALLRGDGFYNQANGFDEYYAHAVNGGNDAAQLYDSAGSDQLTAFDTHVVFQSDSFYHNLRSFDRVFAYSYLGGHDTAEFYDSSGNDHFRATPAQAEMSGGRFYNFARGFDSVRAYAMHGGEDSAELRDSNGDDLLVSAGDVSTLSGSGFENSAHGFERTVAAASSGSDRAVVQGSGGDDWLVVSAVQTVLNADGFQLAARGFDELAVDAGGGNDQLTLQDVHSDYRIETGDDLVALRGSGYSCVVANVESWELAPSLASWHNTASPEELPSSSAAPADAQHAAELSAATPQARQTSLGTAGATFDGERVFADGPATRASVEVSEEAEWQSVLDQLESLLEDTRSLLEGGELSAVDELFASLGGAA